MKLILLLVGIATVQVLSKPPKVIDLPEEIQLAKKGDKLIVLKVTADTIYTGFDNPQNH